jgi:hypothetical protein
LLLCAIGAAQSVSVYSELTRIDPRGQPVRADRGVQSPREILSPAIARNAMASFQMVVEGQPEQPYTFQVVQNPDNAVRITVYRERYSRVGDEWVPDALEPVPAPFDGRFGDGRVDGQTAQTFWVDVFADRTAPVRRIRIEAQAYLGDGWIVYPLEVRVRPAMMGKSPLGNPAAVEDISRPLTASAIAAWRGALCGSSEVRNQRESALTIRDFIARNAAQDVRFAGGVPPASLLSLTGATDRATFCRGARPVRGGEEYLRIRDALIGAVE